MRRIGATAGGVAGLLSNEGVSDEDASYYEGRISDGGYFVGVHADRAGTPIEEAREILIAMAATAPSAPARRRLNARLEGRHGKRILAAPSLSGPGRAPWPEGHHAKTRAYPCAS